MTDAVGPVSTEAALLQRVAAWIDDDPDERTQVELRALLTAARDDDATAVAELHDRFDSDLEFGTAGLRGAIGGGPARMNRAVVSRAAAGLAAHVLARGGGTVVVGFDARTDSDVFARDTAEVMSGAGLRVLVLPRPLPTPVLAFAIRHLGADAGVMVTASHNPPQDNGYKVYLGDGAQIVPPDDALIAAAMAVVGPLRSLPRSDDWTTLGEEVVEAYLGRAVSLLPPGPRNLTVAYTPLHGVGGATLVELLRRSGFTDPVVVAEQAEPDAAFPTVAFPNPEEPGAMDLVLAAAAHAGADLVLANDPDADRCAVAVPSADGFRVLTGDELGVLLGWWMVTRPSRPLPHDATLACSLVSSSRLAAIAADAGLRSAATLTGFKWISRVPGLLYGYEEALGYCVDPAGVRDKDGITAALLVCELVSVLGERGLTLPDVLDLLDSRHGVHVTSQLTLRTRTADEVGPLLDRVREQPPTSLGGRPVERIDDLGAGVDGLPPTPGLRFVFDRGRVVVRPSGTEPKLKCYLEVALPPGGDLTEDRDAARATLAAIRADLAAALGVAP